MIPPPQIAAQVGLSVAKSMLNDPALLPTTDWFKGGHMTQTELIIITLWEFFLGASESVGQFFSAVNNSEI